jgi:hypothetical protein
MGRPPRLNQIQKFSIGRQLSPWEQKFLHRTTTKSMGAENLP